MEWEGEGVITFDQKMSSFNENLEKNFFYLLLQKTVRKMFVIISNRIYHHITPYCNDNS